MGGDNKIPVAAGEAVPFGEIVEPGLYYVEKTGQLVRVPAEALRAGRGPLISFSGTRPMLVRRLSEDPWLAIGKARDAAREGGLVVRF